MKKKLRDTIEYLILKYGHYGNILGISYHGNKLHTV